jgi:hypothetical protein
MKLTREALRSLILREMKTLNEGPPGVPSSSWEQAQANEGDASLLARDELLQLGVGNALQQIIDEMHTAGIEDDDIVKSIIFEGLEHIFEAIY